MTPESTKDLLKAMLDHYELLFNLSDVLDEELFFSPDKQHKNITLLKDAGLIEEMMPDHFIPGLNIDALRDIIDTTQYNTSTSINVTEFKNELKEACQAYRSERQQLLKSEHSQANPRRRLQSVQNICMREVNKFRKRLNQIESDISGNLGSYSNPEDKIRRSAFYLELLQNLSENTLSHLVLERLLILSTTDETNRIIEKMSRRLEAIREKMKILYVKVQDFNLKVRRQSEKSRLISLTYLQLSYNELRFDDEDLTDELVMDNAFLSDSLSFHYRPNIALHNLSQVEQGVLMDLIDKANPEWFYEDDEIPEIEEESFLEQMPSIAISSRTDAYNNLISEQFRALAKQIKQAGKPVSVMMHWQGEGTLKEQVNPSAWLYIIGVKMFEAKKDFAKNKTLKIRGLTIEYYETNDYGIT